MSDLKDRLKALRKSNNLTQEELGDAIGVSYSQISAMESGRSAPQETIAAIAKHFKVSLQWILNGEGESPKGVVVKLRKEANEVPWRDEAYTALKAENERLWRLIEKITHAPAGSIANFKRAVGLAGKGRTLHLTAQAA